MPTPLSGNKAPTRADRTVDTEGANVKFSTDLGVDGYRDMPGLVAEARTFKDPSPKDIRLSSEQLQGVNDLETLGTTIAKAFEDNKAYLGAEEITGNNENLGVSSLRKQAFFNGIAKDLESSNLPATDKQGALKMLKRLEEESYMNREITFDTGKLDTYPPYTKPFDKGVRKIEALAPPGVEREAITAELNYITDRKTRASGWGNVSEGNAEETLGLRPVDRDNGGQALSLAKDSVDSFKPKYVVINVNTDGLPEGMEEHAGKSVVRDGENLVFDKTSTAVPAELAEHLTEKAASKNTGLRLMESAETKRGSFPYDWNQNGGVDVDGMNIGWWGHCHIEAPLAALKLAAGSDVTVFDARSKGESTFGATDVNDLLFALMDADRYADINTGRAASAETTTFVGNRNDTIGGQHPGDKMILTVGGREIPFSFKLTGLYDVDDAEKSVNPDDSFSPTVVTEGLKFEKNPAFSGLREQDWSVISGDRKFEGSVEYMDVNSRGGVERKKADILIDPKNPSDEPILLSSELGRGSYPPSVTKYYLNQKTGNLESRQFEAAKKEDGSYEMKPVGEENKVFGAVGGMNLSRELTKESVIELHNHFLDAARRGVSFVTEKDSGHMVWNYGTDSFKINKVEEDGDFVKYEVADKTQGGTKTWSYILKYDDEGNAVDAHAFSAPPDFVFRPEKTVTAPLVRAENGSVLYNSAAYERGFLVGEDGKISDESLSFFRYASDVLYASLVDPAKDNQFVIMDDQGEMYFYDTKEAYEADVAKLKGDTAEVTD
ncbi:MAG: hypothetical protein HOI23_07840 [Deltaproteobacteria bacterium]|nr:hypothetical protein [Deltaproteobacteria bacterium]